jgi:hypothetical protein
VSAASTKISPAPESPAKDGKKAPSGDLQQLWFATLRREWSSLVVVPASVEASAPSIARALADNGELRKGSPVKLIAAEGVDLAGSSQLIVEITTHVSKGGLVIVSIDPVTINQAGIPIAMAADAALMCVRLGWTDVATGRRAIELIGADKFIGSVVQG